MTTLDYVLGVDPGYANGAMCVLSPDLKDTCFLDVHETSLQDIASFFNTWAPLIKMAVLEKVSASPRMGVVSAFNFGRGYGWVEAMLTAHNIPFQVVAPQKWLTVVGSRPIKETLPYDATQKERDRIRRSNKNDGKKATFDWAKKMFPTAELRSFSKDSNRADALGIAYWGWKEFNARTS